MAVLTGWHYTTASAWESIRRDGAIKPYVPHPRHCLGLSGLLPGGKGIFVWTQWEVGLSRYGIIFDRAIQKREFRVVCLEVRYRARLSARRRFLRRHPRDRLNLSHYGSWNLPDGDEWIYHRSPFDLVVAEVPLRDVRCLGEWDLGTFMDACQQRNCR